MIKIRDLTFEYFDRDDEGNLTEMVNAIRGINFDAGEGEFIVVAGVNGSGKSTFAKILNRLLLPIEGTVLIGGLDAMQEENIIPIRKMVGMVFQNPDDQLIGSVVEEDVAFGAENIGVPHKELVKRVEDALAQVGLSASMRIEELSGGGKQKVAIAGVLAMKQGITIILITHLMEELLLADWIYVMHQGRLAMKGSRNALFAEPEKLRSFGLELPMTVQLSHALAERGCVRTKDLFSVEAIAERIYKEHPYAFLKEKTMEPASVDKKAKVLSQAIVFQHVNLSYGKKLILNDVCCSIEKGAHFTDGWKHLCGWNGSDGYFCGYCSIA